MNRNYFLFFLFIFNILFINAGNIPDAYITKSRPDFIFPVETTNPLLSANFGELREDHFHSGIDIKTGGKEGLKVLAVADGYISRISIKIHGYGNALYINHPNGFTSVYGHLKCFTPKIDSLLQKIQLKENSFVTDTVLPHDVLKIKQGEIIALSGNSGGSFGPHLHFEIRDTKTEEPIDPLIFTGKYIKDNIPPRIYNIKIYAEGERGALSSGKTVQKIHTIRKGKGIYKIAEKPDSAWGKISLGINAYDKMDRTYNKYGISEISVYVNDAIVFSYNITRISFKDTRYVNSFIDYSSFIKEKGLYSRSAIDPGNKLKNVYTYCKDMGYITINEKKPYHIKYVLKDRKGNTSELKFTLQGKKMAIPHNNLKGHKYMYYWSPNFFSTPDIYLFIPANSLYKNLNFKYKSDKDGNNFSKVIHICENTVPIHKKAALSIRIKNDNRSNKKEYYIAQLNEKGDTVYCGGKYRKGIITTKINKLGTYTVLADSIKPSIKTDAQIPENNILALKIKDTESGISHYEATIDNENVIFSYDYKKDLISLNLAKMIYPIEKNKKHDLKLHVYDKCGNVNFADIKFFY